MSRAAEPTRRERTRDALRQAALRRFVADGFEATSIADIAGDVGVTTRTFYRYFASKDEVLFADYEARLDWFRRALSVRPRREPITTSVLNAIDSFPDDPEVVSEIARMRAGGLDQRRIEAHIQRVQAELGREIEAHLIERAGDHGPNGAGSGDGGTGGSGDGGTDGSGDGGTGGDGAFLASVAAHAIAAAVFTALDRWMTGADHDLDELSRLTALALGSLDAGLRAEPPAGEAPRR